MYHIDALNISSDKMELIFEISTPFLVYLPTFYVISYTGEVLHAFDMDRIESATPFLSKFPEMPKISKGCNF